MYLISKLFYKAIVILTWVKNEYTQTMTSLCKLLAARKLSFILSHSQKENESNELQ